MLQARWHHPQSDSRPVVALSLPLLAAIAVSGLASPGEAKAFRDAPPAAESAATDAPADEGGEESVEPDGEGSASLSTSGAKGKGRGKGKGGKEARLPSGMRGRIGFGAIRTISGLNGLHGRFYVLDRFSLGLMAGFASFSYKEANPDTGEFTDKRTVGRFGAGFEGFFWAAQGDRSQQVHADFGVGARVLIYKGFTGANEDTEKINDPLEVDVEIPVSIPVWIGRRVALVPEFGVAFRYVPGDREPDDQNESDLNPGTGAAGRLGGVDGPGWGVEVGDHAGLFIGLGVAYHFGRLKDG